LRSAKGWTLEELAERSGLSKPFLSRLESGDRQPSIAAVLTLARVFGVPMGSLFESGRMMKAVWSFASVRRPFTMAMASIIFRYPELRGSTSNQCGR
jgi:transcriptional regulator with XRE-family HTH domain